jgi:hypothetical protein
VKLDGLLHHPDDPHHLRTGQSCKRLVCLGISHTTLHRIERGEHHLTLHKLETVITKLKIRLSDIFPGEF